MTSSEAIILCFSIAFIAGIMSFIILTIGIVIKWSSKKQEIYHDKVSGNDNGSIQPSKITGFQKEDNDEILVEGHRSVAIGIDAKLVPIGKCNHPDIRYVSKDILNDGLPIPEHLWTHCIFCKKYESENDMCFFAGECDHRIDIEGSTV